MFLCSVCLCSAQNVDELREQAKEYEQQIAKINKLLKTTANEQNDVGKNLKLTTQKISSRNKMVSNLDKQIDIVEKNLGNNGAEIMSLNRKLGSLQKHYASLVKLAYFSYKNNSLETLLGAESDFHQAIRNVTNIEKITAQCQAQASQIDGTKRQITGKIENLEKEQKRIAELLEEKKKETSELEKEKQQISKYKKDLDNQSSKLRRQAAENQAKLQSLQKQIQTIIAQESRSVADKPVNTALSGEFEQNRGKLPSPVGGGVVVDRFGTHNHPTQPNIKVMNNGINIACQSGSNVRSVFDGEVKRMFLVPGMGNSIIVRHGKFLTVYSNLSSVSVKIGDKVKTGQGLGNISGSESVLHFEIWNETTMLDPERWINI